MRSSPTAATRSTRRRAWSRAPRIAGHWARRGNANVWVSGVWTRPPHDGMAWEKERWEQRNGPWYSAEGHWRYTNPATPTAVYEPPTQPRPGDRRLRAPAESRRAAPSRPVPRRHVDRRLLGLGRLAPRLGGRPLVGGAAPARCGCPIAGDAHPATVTARGRAGSSSPRGGTVASGRRWSLTATRGRARLRHLGEAVRQGLAESFFGIVCRLLYRA